MLEIEQTLWVQVYLQVLNSTDDDNEAETQADRAVKAFRRSDNYFRARGDD